MLLFFTADILQH